MEIRQAWVTIAAADFERSLKFYRAILGQDAISEIPDRYAEFLMPGLKIGIYKPRVHESQATPYPTLSLCLEVEDLEDAIDRFRTLGYPPPGGIVQASHGREIYAYDPDGNRLILYQPARN